MLNDIFSLQQQTSLLSSQNRLLEMVARGEPLCDTLQQLALLIEAQLPGLYCSVLLLDEDGIHIHPGAGPNLPAEYMAALDGYAIGPNAGSCGTAMYLQQPVIVTDILTDPLWTPYKGLIEHHGFRACWSTPIFLNAKVVLGSFAMYYREVRSPGPKELELTNIAVHIAGIAIERTRREEELRRHREELAELIQQRTNELTIAKNQAEHSVKQLKKTNKELASTLRTLRVTQEALVHSKKLTALGDLVAGVAHELSTPLGNCLFAASTLSEHTAAVCLQYSNGVIKRGELDSYLLKANSASDIIMRNLQRAATLVSSFKLLATDNASWQRATFVLKKRLQQILLQRSKQLHSSIKIVLKASNAISLDSYPAPFEQILLSLIDNALIHAFEGRNSGTVLIEAKLLDSDIVRISVTDDGVGIPAENIERVLEPFFTTKLGTGQSGLGLSMVYNIVTRTLGGQLDIRSTLNEGTCVVLTFPRKAPINTV